MAEMMHPPAGQSVVRLRWQVVGSLSAMGSITHPKSGTWVWGMLGKGKGY